jgi:serine/threonine protein kinase
VIGTILGGRYELLSKIGEGGMSVVYKARCRILDRIVAVKILKEEFSKDKGFVERFKTEALAVAKLSHPNIVNIYDVGQQGNVYYIVMELVEGESLKDVITREAPFSVQKAVDIAIMICDGIQHAHEKGIIHRDIKPHNILITNSGIVKVADFGIAQAVSMKTITYGGNVFGSVHYISPEQAKGKPIGQTTDIYSVGCILYEMLTGKVPFDAESPITLALKHIHDEPPSPRKINEKIPPAVESIILQAMEKMPEHRFASAEEMRNALYHANAMARFSSNGVNDRNLTVSPGPEEEEKDEMKRRKKRKLRSKGIAFIAIAVLGLLSGFLTNSNLFGKEVVVPDVKGKAVDVADKQLRQLGLEMEIIGSQASDEFEKDTIISQEPADGQKVKEGRVIKVILSKGAELQRVPSVVGLPLSDAEIYIRNAGLHVDKVGEMYDERYAVNTVISQDPPFGKQVKKGTSVNLMISKGKPPKRIPMPNLVGLSLEQAKKSIEDNNLILQEIKREESNKFFADKVIDQSISAGVLIDEQAGVVLTVSKGPGPKAKTKAIEVTLPDDRDYYQVAVVLTDADGRRNVYSQLHGGADTVNLGITYRGEGNVEVWLNGEKYKEYHLD